MSVQGVYTGTCACASTGIHVCAWAEGWQRQAEGWKGAELPSWVHGGSWGHATPWHGGGGGAQRPKSRQGWPPCIPYQAPTFNYLTPARNICGRC